jgi:hypothetical protein
VTAAASMTRRCYPNKAFHVRRSGKLAASTTNPIVYVAPLEVPCSKCSKTLAGEQGEKDNGNRLSVHCVMVKVYTHADNIFQ